MNEATKGLWRDRNFLLLWAGETISLFGSHITYLALPLTAAIMLSATPAQMGYMGAARTIPFLFLTLFAGVWVDHHRRRPILIIANLGRAALMGTIPLLALQGTLTMNHLYGIVFFVGSLTVFFDLAYNSYLPSLVLRKNLVEANSKLQTSASAAELGGPGLAGLMIELISAPVTIVLDAVSFLVSAITLIAIRREEPVPEAHPHSGGLRGEIVDGLRITFGNPYLRAIAGEAATFNLFWAVIETVFVLYATRDLAITPALLGLIVTAGSVGALAGALIAQPAADHLGTGRAILAAMITACVVYVCVPLITGPLTIPILAAVYFLVGAGSAVANIHVISLRQSITPDHLLGRMTASYRLLIFGTLPVGSLLGGFLGEQIGTRATLAVGAVGLAIAVLWVVFSPVRRLQTLPQPEPTT